MINFGACNSYLTTNYTLITIDLYQKDHIMTVFNFYTRKQEKPAKKITAQNRLSKKTDSEIMSSIFVFVKRLGAEKLLNNLISFGAKGVLLSCSQIRILSFLDSDYLERADYECVLQLISKLRARQILRDNSTLVSLRKRELELDSV